MAIHNVEPTRETLHGSFSRDYPAILEIEPGDTVRYRTLDAGWGLEGHSLIDGSRRTFGPRDPQRDEGHALCGPIAIRGAMPGMTLGIRVDSVVPGGYGWTSAGGWDSSFNRRLNLVGAPHCRLIWTLDATTMTASDQHGHSVPLHPFMGVMGLPPDEEGIHDTAPPRVCGGNLDCKELVAGSTLYLPISVPSALFSVGDGHGAQGDGEVGGTAIECPMDLVELTFTLHEDMRLAGPRADTPAGWITFGIHEHLEEAMFLALDAMLELMGTQYNVERSQALALASVVVNLHVTQIVNGPYGVHAILPHGIISLAL